MVTVFAEGLRPSVGVRCVKAALAGVSVLSLAQNMLSHSKTAPTSWFSRDGGGGSACYARQVMELGPPLSRACFTCPGTRRPAWR